MCKSSADFKGKSPEFGNIDFSNNTNDMFEQNK